MAIFMSIVEQNKKMNERTTDRLYSTLFFCTYDGNFVADIQAKSFLITYFLTPLL